VAVAEVIGVAWASLSKVAGIAKASIVKICSVDAAGGGDPVYEPGPGVVEILEEHFEGSGAEVAWTKSETDGTVNYDQATTEETWGASCARFTLPSGTEACITKSITPTQKLFAHFEFVLRAADFTGSDPGSGFLPIFIADGPIQESNRAGLQVNLYSVGDKTGSFNLDVMCMGSPNFSPNITVTGIDLAYDTLHKVDIKWDNKVGGNLTLKLDGVTRINEDLESMTYDEPSVLQSFDRIIHGPSAQTYYPVISGSYTVDKDNIRHTTDDWA
jgi:hypothetical protein